MGPLPQDVFTNTGPAAAPIPRVRRLRVLHGCRRPRRPAGDTGAGGVAAPQLRAALAIVAAASVLALATEDLPRFFWGLQQWYLLAPTLVIGTALQVLAWSFWSAVAWGAGRAQGSRATFRTTLLGTGLAYLPALVQAAALAVDTSQPLGVTGVALIKAAAAWGVAAAVVASLTRTQALPWPRAVLSGIGWLLTAFLVTAGSLQQVSMFGGLP